MECSCQKHSAWRGAGRRCHGSGDPGGSETRGTAYRSRRLPGCDGSGAGRHPAHPGVLAEPRVLAAREPAGPDHGAAPRLLLVDLAGEERQHLLVAQRPARGPALPEAQRLEASYLLDQPVGPHPVDPAGDPLVEDGPVDVHAELHRLRIDVRRGRHPRGERTPGQLDHLQRAHDPASVRLLDVAGRLGVEPAQPVVQGGGPAARPGRPRAGAGPRDPCRGSRAGRAPPACRAPSRRPAPAPRRGHGSPRPPRAPAPGTRRRWPPRARRARRPGGAGCRAARTPAASRCRCPCRGTAASSRC